jgi:hypothetical protein
MKRVLGLLVVILAITACGSNAGDRLLGSSDKTPATPTPPSLQQIQVNQISVLPPFGMKVRADVASLKVRVSSSKNDTADRLAAIREAIEQISELAAKNDSVDLQDVSVSRVSSSSDRESAVPYLGERYDSSSVIVTLTTKLAEHNQNLLESLIVFNSFLNTLNLPETITLDTLSVDAEISNPEIYREQVIARVYQELEAVQEEYGQSVKFEITGLHGGLQTIPLNDAEYYLYIEPAIVVIEF